MKNRILVALDGEKASANTAEYVGRVCANARDAAMHIVLFHVLPPLPPYLESSGKPTGEDFRERVRTETEDAAKRMLKEMKSLIVRDGANPKSIATETVEPDVDIVAQILDAASRHDCDTIVIGRRGRSMFTEFFGGSVAERLLRNPTGFTIWLVE